MFNSYYIEPFMTRIALGKNWNNSLLFNNVKSVEVLMENEWKNGKKE